jgi:hypothetical protein
LKKSTKKLLFLFFARFLACSGARLTGAGRAPKDRRLRQQRV